MLVSLIGVSSSGRRRGTGERLHTDELQAYVERAQPSAVDSVDSVYPAAAASGGSVTAGGSGTATGSTSDGGQEDGDAVADAYTGGLTGAAAAATFKTGSALGAGGSGGSSGAVQAARSAAGGDDDPGSLRHPPHCCWLGPGREAELWRSILLAASLWLACPAKDAASG